MNAHRGVASVVTGAGKTVLALKCIETAVADGIEKFIVIVPTIALQDQWALELQEVLGVSPLDIARVGGESPDTGALDRRIIISTMASARYLDLTQFSPSFMLIVDECHRVASEANRRVLAYDANYSLGLSATPIREYDDWFEEHVSPALGPIIYEYTYSDALRDEVITPFELRHYRVPLSEAEAARIAAIERQLRIVRSQTGEDDEAVKRLLMQRARVSQNAKSRVATTVAIVEEHPGRRTIIFHESVDIAETITVKLQQAGHSAETYHSRQHTATRYRNLMLFRRRQIDVLVTCRALDEGIDIPDVSLGVIAASSSSVRQRIQRLGRIVRRASKKESSLICSLYALDTERQRLEVEQVRLLGLAEAKWYRAE